MTAREYHPLANVFPLMADAELKSLAADIKSEGLKFPILLHEGKILDGRNRYAACEIAEVEPRYEDFSNGDPLKYVISTNVKRRNLNETQRGVVAERLANMGEGRPSETSSYELVSMEEAAEWLNVGMATVKRVREVRKKAPDLYKECEAGTLTAGQAFRKIKDRKQSKKRAENSEKVAKAQKPEELHGNFSTIVIDPPWDWGDEGDVNQMGRAKPDYATISIEELPNLPVGQLADADCHLYLWVTGRSLPKAFGLLDAWGFRYITALVWPKPSFGMGNYFRGQTEFVLFGVKGSLALKRKNAATLLPAWKRGKGHSAKPPEFLEFVESCSPGPYLEMFARSKRDGWKHWGEDS